MGSNESNSLAGKIAIVTGSTSGIGKSIARRLALEGAKVVVTGRTKATGERVVREIRDLGKEATFIEGDVLSLEQMRRLSSKTLEQFGQIDILVASAGGIVASPKKEGERQKDSQFFYRLDPEDVARQVATSTLAKINPVHAVIEHMLSRQTGSILFITSEGGRFPTPGQTVVSLAAGGLIMATKVLAKEMARSRIRVNAIAVTLVQDTPSWDYFTKGQSDRAGVYEKIVKKAPYGLAKPEDIAEVATFLVSGAASFITGATISPTGGITYS